MKPTVQKIALAASLACNALFAALFALALASPTASVSFLKLGGGGFAAAALASVPPSGSAVFNTVEIAMKKNEQAALQFSIVSGGKQANLLINALYDPDIIEVKPSGYGVIITARTEGETLMQAISNDGIKNVALIKVIKELP